MNHRSKITPQNKMASLTVSKNIMYSLALSGPKTFENVAVIQPALLQLLMQIFLDSPFLIFFAKVLGQANLHGNYFIIKKLFLTKKVFEAKVSGCRKLIQQRIEHRSTFKQRIKNSNSVQRKLYNTTMATKVKPH